MGQSIPTIQMQEYFGKGHTFHTDNYYTGLSLALHVQTETCILLCILLVPLEKGTTTFFIPQNDQPIIAHKYRSHKDKAGNQQKVVHVLSTCHDPVIGNTQRRKHSNGDFIFKPLVAKEYNSHMAGVDHVDQQLHSFDILRKSYEWYKKLPLRLISQCILNAYKVYSNTTFDKITFLKFLENIILSTSKFG